MHGARGRRRWRTRVFIYSKSNGPLDRLTGQTTPKCEGEGLISNDTLIYCVIAGVDSA